MQNILEVKNINKKYKNFELKDISFSIPKGHIIGLIGENGAGKSTTIKAILNLIKLDKGEVLFLDKPFDTSKVDLKEHIGVVFDEINFFKETFPSQIDSICKKMFKQWNSEVFKEYLTKFSLPESSIKSYSKGMRMKLNIAIALSHDAKLLILDEATTGLDPVMRDDILDIFLDIIKDKEHSIIMSSHITSDLEKIANQILFIHKGELIFLEDKKTLYKEYGKIIGNKNELLRLINKEDIFKLNKLHGLYEFDEPIQVLVKDKEKIKEKYPSLEVFDILIDDILLGYVKGEDF